PPRDVLGNVEEGVASTRALLARFEELSLRLGEAGPDEMDRLMEEYAKVQDAIEAANAWDPDAPLETATARLQTPGGCRRGTRTPPPCRGGSGAGWRCAGCCCRDRTCCCSTSPPTTWTPRACSGWSSTWPPTRGQIWADTTTPNFSTKWPRGTS